MDRIKIADFIHYTKKNLIGDDPYYDTALEIAQEFLKLHSPSQEKMKTKYKYIHFEEMDWLQTGKTKHYDCLNNKTNYSLGIVEWERGWRQYIFTPSGSDTIFSAGCLLDIVGFIKQQSIITGAKYER